MRSNAIKTVLAIVLVLSTASLGYAQAPCSLDFKLRLEKNALLSNGYNFQAIARDMDECDSLVLLSDTLYQSLFIQVEYYKSLSTKFDSLVTELDEGRALRDSMITSQQSYIAFQQGVITKYDSLLVQSNQLVRDATKNTDRALRRLTLLRLTSIGGIAIGVGGLLVALVANN